MEEKLLKLLKAANTLNERQNKLYVQIIYTADDIKKLRIEIIEKSGRTYIENLSISLTENSVITIDSITDLIESYTGGAANE